IFITHRIAGPIYALERRMKQIAKEGITGADFRIRRTDEFQEVAEAVNEMIASLQKQMEGYEEKLKKGEENKLKRAA
ncbi:MAG: HAMP domain-containing protein, partial [Deltaproteobacteria bacterium]